MKRLQLSAVAVLMVVAVLMLAACAPVSPGGAAPAASTGGGEAAAAGPVTITWALWGSPEEVASHQRVADAFMQEHPDIKVEIWNQPWDDYFTKIQALWASGDTKVIPDIAFLWPTPQYAAEGVLENLDPYIEKANYNLDDYWPGLLESAKYNGSVYGFPRDIESNIIYYSKDMFDKAGVAYPSNDWTWDDFLAAAEKLTQKDASGNTTVYALAAEGGKWPKWVNQNGGAILDDYVNPTKCMLTEPASVQGIQFFSDMMNNGLAMRPADLNQAGGDAAVFSSGQAAMILQNSSRVSTFNQAGLNYDIAPAPIPAGGKRWNGAGGAAWVMSSGSDNKDAAWTFLQWLQSTDGGEKVYTEAGEIFPALQSVANSPAFMTDKPPANKEGFIIEAGASGVGGFGYFPEWGELSGSVIEPGLEKVWAGEISAEEGAAEICKQVDAFLSDNGYPK
ncbi:MAG: sugar ABC transporter substrate-binding protein [Caldilineaceae bacterium]